MTSVTAIMPEKSLHFVSEEYRNRKLRSPLWTKIESSKVVYFAGTRDGADGGEKLSWGRRGGREGHRGLCGWETLKMQPHKMIQPTSSAIAFLNCFGCCKNVIKLSMQWLFPCCKVYRPGEQLIFQKSNKGGNHAWMFGGLGGLQYMASQPSLSI